MKKIKVSADTVLSILQGIMNDEEINTVIDDPSAPEQWKNKKINEVLNVDYYTFKHRPFDTELVVRELVEQGGENILQSLNKSFCLLSLVSTERVYSKDNDIVTVTANLEYWLQTDKIKILENLIEDMSIATNGIRIPVQIGEEERQVLIAIGTLNISEIQDATEYGEMAVCDLNIDIVFYPEVISRSDYTAEFATKSLSGVESWVKVPFSSLSISNTMTQKSVPKANNVRSVGNINLSRVKTFVFVFDGYVNDFIDELTDTSLIGDILTTDEKVQEIDNNKSILLRLTRKNKVYIFNCVVKDHMITIQEDTGNETHSLTLTTRGMKDGNTQS